MTPRTVFWAWGENAQAPILSPTPQKTAASYNQLNRPDLWY